MLDFIGFYWGLRNPSNCFGITLIFLFVKINLKHKIMALKTDRFANSADKNRMYREQLITREDLNEFRELLLSDLTAIINSKPLQQKQWLKSNEVRKLLNISAGTLQNLRINGTLTYTKIGGILYFDNSDIEKLLNGNKVNALPTLFK